MATADNTVPNISILLVDDNAGFRGVVRRFLETEDDLTVVGEAGGGLKALSMVPELKPDVVLLDLAMPDLSGLEVIPHLRAIAPEVSIIVLTLLDSAGYCEAALVAGADDFVPKAELGATLVPSIRRTNSMHLAGDKTTESRAGSIDAGRLA
jgi:DNA-binding NarL/FixJ family response regulator